MKNKLIFVGIVLLVGLVAMGSMNFSSRYSVNENTLSSPVATENMSAKQNLSSEPESPIHESAGEQLSEEMESASAHEIDDEEADFRYHNLEKLMSRSVTGMDPYEQEMLMEQIINELPEVVKSGRMHPFDAVVAHAQILKRQGVPYDHARMEALKAEYMSTYPLALRQPHSEMH